MYTLYGWLQANEWFSNKVFGENQLSKTAEGTCNQTGFEQQLLHVCRMDLMNYFVREPGTAVRQFINEKQQISNCIRGLFVRPTSPNLHARFLSDFASVSSVDKGIRKKYAYIWSNCCLQVCSRVSHSSSPVQGPTMEFNKSYVNRHNEGKVCFLSRTPPQKKAPSIPRTLNYQMNFSFTVTPQRKLWFAPSLLKITSTGCHTTQESHSLHKAIRDAHANGLF